MVKYLKVKVKVKNLGSIEIVNVIVNTFIIYIHNHNQTVFLSHKLLTIEPIPVFSVKTPWILSIIAQFVAFSFPNILYIYFINISLSSSSKLATVDEISDSDNVINTFSIISQLAF